jgi:Transglutaminase-like superfamily
MAEGGGGASHVLRTSRPGISSIGCDARALYNRRSLPESFNANTVLEAWVLLWGCRIGLWFAPFPQVLMWVQFCANHLRSSQRMDPGGVVHCIQRALPFTWHSSCLTQALAGWIMLTRHGATSRVKIGVASPEQRGFMAHAWLECDGQVILGDIGLEPFNVIWTLPEQEAS